MPLQLRLMKLPSPFLFLLQKGKRKGGEGSDTNDTDINDNNHTDDIPLVFFPVLPDIPQRSSAFLLPTTILPLLPSQAMGHSLPPLPTLLHLMTLLSQAMRDLSLIPSSPKGDLSIIITKEVPINESINDNL